VNGKERRQRRKQQLPPVPHPRQCDDAHRSQNAAAHKIRCCRKAHGSSPPLHLVNLAVSISLIVGRCKEIHHRPQKKRAGRVGQPAPLAVKNERLRLCSARLLVSFVGVLVGFRRVLMSNLRVLVAFFVVAFLVVLGSGVVRFGCVLVVLGGLAVRFVCHKAPLSSG
jgi:hypothetical protein